MEIRIPMKSIGHEFCLTDSDSWLERITRLRNIDQTNHPNSTCMTRCSMQEGLVTCIFSYKISKLPCILHVSDGSILGNVDVDYVIDYIYVDPSKRGQQWSAILLLKTIKTLQAINIGISSSCVVAVPMYPECAEYVKHIADKYEAEPYQYGNQTYYIFE